VASKKKVFIAEITARAFIVADSNKRRTLSRADIAKALSKSDQFDFLIDVVPRDEPFVPGVSGPGKNSKKTISGSASTKRDPVRVDAFLYFSSHPRRSCKVLTLLHPRTKYRRNKMHRVRHRETPLFSKAEIVLTWMACPTPAC
jgi:hypothetical protein